MKYNVSDHFGKRQKYFFLFKAPIMSLIFPKRHKLLS